MARNPFAMLLLAGLAIGGCGLVGCGGGQKSSEVLPFQPAGPDVAPDPRQPGPFPVGVRTYYLVDETRPDPTTGEPRFLPTEVWYPAVQAAKDGPFWAYDAKDDVSPELLGDKYDAFMGAELPLIQTATVRDAKLDLAHGPYPVIFYSHGANSLRWQSIFYTGHLASHGYVVISPDHQYNTIWDIIRDGFDQAMVVTSSYKRLDDLRFLLDAFLDFNEQIDHPLRGALDRRQVAATGHSFGGFTSICMPCFDDRFKAAVAQSPLISLTIGWCDLKAYPAPLMVQGGTLDDTLPWRDQYCDYRAMEGDPPRYLMELAGAGHYTFADICQLDLASLKEELDFEGVVEEALRDGCADYNLPVEQAHPVINHYATAFFNLQLRGSTGSQAFLVPQADPLFDPVRFFDGPVPDYPDEACGN